MYIGLFVYVSEPVLKNKLRIFAFVVLVVLCVT